jgi:hypothetical protein
MEENSKKEELKKKLNDYFDTKINDLTKKFQTDIEEIETIKYNFVDEIVKKISELHTEFEEIEKEKEEKKEEKKPEKKEEKKNEKKEEKKTEKKEEKKNEKKEEKKTEKKEEKKPKIDKLNPKTNIDPLARPKTPLGSTKKGEKKEKEKHETLETRKIKPETTKEKKDNKSEATKEKKDNKTSSTHTGGGAKPPVPKKTDKKVSGKADLRPKTAIVKKKGKNDPKKGKKDNKKEVKKEEVVEEVKEEEPKVEEKKPVIINPKYICSIPDEFKNNNPLVCIYFALKGKYFDKKNTLHLATYSPLLYKSFNNQMKFLLDDKKKEVENKANEIEKFLNNYGDLNEILTKECELNKKILGSVVLFKKKEEEEILKMPEIPKEAVLILKCLYYIIDEKFDPNMSDKDLFNNMFNNILTKNEDNNFKSLLNNYIAKNKYLNLTQEKFDNLNKTINENTNILNMATVSKICRPMSFFCFLLKKVYDYINLKTLDEQYYFNLRLKNDELQKYKDFIYLIDNNGKPREPVKEVKAEAPKESEDKTEETTNVEEHKNDEQSKEEKKTEEKKEEPKVEEPKKEEEKKEEQKIEEQNKPEEKKDEEKKEEEKKEEEKKNDENKIEEKKEEENKIEEKKDIESSTNTNETEQSKV